MVCSTSCWRSVIRTLAALPGMARTSSVFVKVGYLAKYRKVASLMEGRFSQGVLVCRIARQQGLQCDTLDEIVTPVDERLRKNRAARSPSSRENACSTSTGS